MKNNEITLDGIDYEIVVDGDDVILQSTFQDITLSGCWQEAKDDAEKSIRDGILMSVLPPHAEVALDNISQSDIDNEAWDNLNWHILNYKHERVIDLNI